SRRGGDTAFGSLILISALIAGGVSYRLSARYPRFLQRWAATVITALGGTFLLSSLALFAPIIAASLYTSIPLAPFIPFIGFALAAAGAGVEAILAVGLWTALVLASERLVLRLSGRELVTGDVARLRWLELTFRASGLIALCLSLAGAGRFAKGLMRIPSIVEAILS
ncbi:MAG TPA: hypothetical protein VJ890_22195, partial [Vineibacter sp.]|nr:hypothetical protein [Vineibacter sp.]